MHGALALPGAPEDRVSAKRFTLMGYEDALSWPTVRSVDTLEPTEVLEAACQLLDDSPRCAWVEIWSGAERLHTLQRPRGEA